jgi:hypothetical protein
MERKNKMKKTKIKAKIGIDTLVVLEVYPSKGISHIITFNVLN